MWYSSRSNSDARKAPATSVTHPPEVDIFDEL